MEKINNCLLGKIIFKDKGQAMSINYDNKIITSHNSQDVKKRMWCEHGIKWKVPLGKGCTSKWFRRFGSYFTDFYFHFDSIVKKSCKSEALFLAEEKV